ncbi:MAG TPA: hypothetical protein VI111_09255 [Thermoleophilaceae bacterium]
MARSRYAVTVRHGPKVKRERFENLDAALAAMEQRAAALEHDAQRRPAGGSGLLRRIEPVQQVAARIELRGPGRLRAGVDVRGDGSSEAFTGRLQREVVKQRDDESPYGALRRRLMRS